MFRHLQLPFNGTIKLANYYSSQNVNDVPVKAPVITPTMRVHAASLEPVTGITLKKIRSFSPRGRRDGTAVTGWLQSKSSHC